MNRIFDGKELPPRPELRQFGYAPGNYMITCRVTEPHHQAHNLDKRALCCLACAERLYEEATMVAENPNRPVPPPPQSEPTPAELEQYVGGKLTALKGTMIPLTVERLGKDGMVHTMRFVGTDLRREKYEPKLLIGAGDELVFKDGVFDRAQ